MHSRIFTTLRKVRDMYNLYPVVIEQYQALMLSFYIFELIMDELTNHAHRLWCYILFVDDIIQTHGCLVGFNSKFECYIYIYIS